MQDLQIGLEVEKTEKCVVTYVGRYKTKQGTGHSTLSVYKKKN